MQVSGPIKSVRDRLSDIDAEALIQLPDEVTVIVTEYPLPLAAPEDGRETLMILWRENVPVVIGSVRHVIRWVAIEKRRVFVIVADGSVEGQVIDKAMLQPIAKIDKKLTAYQLTGWSRFAKPEASAVPTAECVFDVVVKEDSALNIREDLLLAFKDAAANLVEMPAREQVPQLFFELGKMVSNYPVESN